MVVVHPSWWSSSRVGLVTAAAKTLADDVLARPRSWLLRQASNAEPEATVVVEIAERLVAIAGAEVVAMPRTNRTASCCRRGGELSLTGSHAAQRRSCWSTRRPWLPGRRRSRR